MTAANPMVSVIVPNYNHARFLRQRIISILNQTFQDFELILLDDCSTDGSCEILQKYATHEKVSHFVANKINSGSAFAQWRKGINLARGKYIWIAESDDFADPKFLEAMCSGMKAGTDVCFCASNVVNEQGEFIRENSIPELSENAQLSGRDFLRRFMQHGNSIANASAVVFRRDSVEKIDVPANMRFCGDWLVWIRLLERGSVSYFPATLNNFRFHSETIRPRGDESSGGTRSYVESIFRPEYLVEYALAIIECYRILKWQWSPQSLTPVLRQVRSIPTAHNEANLIESMIPLGMRVRWLARMIRENVSIRSRFGSFVSQIHRLYRR